jgi:putative transport protein
VLIGQLDIKVDPTVKAVFFSLFLFATGYKVGPQFFRGLKKSAVSQVALTLVFCVTSLVTTIVAARVLGYDSGTAAGLMAGAFTESTVIGTASDTIDRLEIPEAEKTRLKNNIPSPTRSHLVGTDSSLVSVGCGRRGCSSRSEAESQSWRARCRRDHPQTARMAYKEWAYGRIALTMLRRAAQSRIERFEPSERVFIERIRRGAELMDATPETILRSGDVVAIAARRRVLLGGKLPLREEVEDPALLDFPMATFDVVVTKADVAERPLSALAHQHGRGVALGKLIRGGEEIPFGPETIINRGDLLRPAGAVRDVERVGKEFATSSVSSSESDVVFLGLACRRRPRRAPEPHGRGLPSR